MLSANPLLLMAATDGREDCQLTCVVRLCVEPSEYVPVAVNCCVFPLATEAVAGLMLTDRCLGNMSFKQIQIGVMGFGDAQSLPTD